MRGHLTLTRAGWKLDSALGVLCALTTSFETDFMGFVLCYEVVIIRVVVRRNRGGCVHARDTRRSELVVVLVDIYPDPPSSQLNP